MVSKENLEKMEARRSFRNLWHTSLMRTPIDDPTYCCFALWCGPCVSYLLRKRALRDDMSRYECCGGYMPCSGHCGESKCPELCLCSEVFFCFNNSVSSTRFMLQDEFNIQTTKCDNCIIGTMVFLQSLACIFSILAMITGIDEVQEMARVLDCIADMIACVVCPCMQTQHKLEMDKRDGKLGDQPVMFAPPIQEMSRTDPCIPPAIGYPPPGVYPPPSVYPPPGVYPPSDPKANAFPPAIYPMQPQPDQCLPPPLYPPYPKDQNDPPATYPPQPQNQQLAAYPPQNQQVYPPPQNQQLAVYPPQPQNEQFTTYPPQPQNEQSVTYPPQPQNQQLTAHPPQQQNQQPTTNPPQTQTNDDHIGSAVSSTK